VRPGPIQSGGNRCPNCRSRPNDLQPLGSGAPRDTCRRDHVVPARVSQRPEMAGQYAGIELGFCPSGAERVEVLVDLLVVTPLGPARGMRPAFNSFATWVELMFNCLMMSVGCDPCRRSSRTCS